MEITTPTGGENKEQVKPGGGDGGDPTDRTEDRGDGGDPTDRTRIGPSGVVVVRGAIV